MKHLARMPLFWIGCGVSLLLLSGCGSHGDRPPIGRVHGIVTLDGKPLSLATIAFRPMEGGRLSTAISSEDGTYELVYLESPRKVLGAKIGENMVYVSTYISEEKEKGPRVEIVPDCYRKKESILKVSIHKGRNEINLNLKSDCGT